MTLKNNKKSAQVEHGFSTQSLSHVILAFITRIFLSQKVGDVESRLTVAQRKVLLSLDVYGPTSMSEIARQEGVTLPAATALMDKLVAMGYVQRVADPRDRRIVLVEPTTEGNSIIENLKQRFMTRLDEILECLTEEDRRELMDALGTLTFIFQKVPALSQHPDRVIKTIHAGGRKPTRFKGDIEVKKSSASAVKSKTLRVKKMSVWLAVLSAAVFLTGCGKKTDQNVLKEVESKTAVKSITVELLTAQEKIVPEKMNVVGSLAANNDSKVAARVEGLVLERLVERGDHVTTGQVLVKLDSAIVQNSLDKAQSQLRKLVERLDIKDPKAPFNPDELPEVKSTIAELELAKSTLNRNESLRTSNSISQADYDKSETAFETARQRYLLARRVAIDSYNDYIVTGLTVRDLLRQLGDMEIKAPFEGMVAEHSVTPGEYVKEGQAVVRLVESNPIRLQMTVPEEAALAMKQGQEVEFSIPGETGVIHRASVAYISPAIDNASRSLTVEALAENSDMSLRPGHFVKAKIVTNPNSKAVVLPESAIKRIGESTVVYVDNNKKTRETVVRVGDIQDGKVSVVEGLKSGDRVILNASKAFEGAMIIETSDASTTQGAKALESATSAVSTTGTK